MEPHCIMAANEEKFLHRFMMFLKGSCALIQWQEMRILLAHWDFQGYTGSRKHVALALHPVDFHFLLNSAKTSFHLDDVLLAEELRSDGVTVVFCGNEEADTFLARAVKLYLDKGYNLVRRA